MRDVGSAPKSSVFFSNSIVWSEITRIFWIHQSGAGICARTPPQNSLPEWGISAYKSGMNTCRFAIVSFAIFSAGSLLAQRSSMEKLAESELPSCLSIYKDIHTHPELSGREEHTSALVAKELRAAGCEVTENFGTFDKPNLKCYGVVGVMKNGNGPTILVRTDMDGLPVQEQTNAPYASKSMGINADGKEVPVMHACGHDI